MRITKQKKLLIEAMDSFSSFFSADDLFLKIQKKDSKLGIATVYRFLKNQVKLHGLHSYQCDGKTIYSKSSKSHCHFICEKCSLVKHIELRNLNFLPKESKDSMCHVQVDVTGVCAKCQKE